jgi:LysR family transcriptional regulator, regulator for bpeEF and oprC
LAGPFVDLQLAKSGIEMSMQQLPFLMRSFIAIADAGSFSAAAARLRVSQSTLSKHVTTLEHYFDVRLLLRTTRSLRLTDEGAIFYENAVIVLAAIDEAEASLGKKSDVAGVVRLTAPLTLAEARIIPLLPKFFDRHPDIEVHLTLSDHALNLAADNIDIAVRVGRLVDDRLNAKQFGVARRVMVAAPAFLDRVGRPETIASLMQLNCISYALHSGGRQWRFDNGTCVDIRGNLHADSPNALRAAALNGIGIVVNARWLFEKDLANGTLEQVLPAMTPVPMPINLILRDGRHVAARTRMLAEFLTTEFAADPLLAMNVPGQL